jgi:quercetin dioxygenase-like cupin family protein
MDSLVRFDDLEWQCPARGVRFKRAEAGGKAIRLVEFTDGFEEPDWCLRGHWGIVLDGELHLNVADGAVIYRKGDALALGPGENTRHKHIAAASPTTLFLVEEL